MKRKRWRENDGEKATAGCVGRAKAGRERVGVRGKDNKGREVQESGDGMDGGKNGGGREGVIEEGDGK